MNAIEPAAKAGGVLTLYGVELSSRLLLGTAQYPSPHVLARASVADPRLTTPRIGLQHPADRCLGDGKATQ